LTPPAVGYAGYAKPATGAELVSHDVFVSYSKRDKATADALLDECCDPAIADGLRRRNIDVTTSQEVGLLEAEDEQQAAYDYPRSSTFAPKGPKHDSPGQRPGERGTT
jgi:hypothetical protein